MIICKPNEIVRLPISVGVSTAVTGVTLVRDIYEPVCVAATALSEYLISITIPSAITAGRYDWFYGKNKGVLEVEESGATVVSYEDDVTVIEYPDAIWGDEQYNTNNVINDNAINLSQTWSSQKIHNMVSGITLDAYTKSETDALLAGKVDTGTVYTKVETDSLLAGKVNLSAMSNYYTTGETYTKTQVDSLIAAFPQFTITVVQTLPSTGNSHTIYLVPTSTATTNDSYDEYLYINTAWERIGSTRVDLSQYYTKTQVDGLLISKVDTGTVYTTGETYTKTQVENLISAATSTAVTQQQMDARTNEYYRISTIDDAIQTVIEALALSEKIKITGNDLDMNL